MIDLNTSSKLYISAALLTLGACSVESVVDNTDEHDFRNTPAQASVASQQSSATQSDASGTVFEEDASSGGVTFALLEPVLSNNCGSCHSKANRLADLDVNSYADVSDPTKFPLIMASIADGSMPPVIDMKGKDKLVAAMKNWADLGFPKDSSDLGGEESDKALEDLVGTDPDDNSTGGGNTGGGNTGGGNTDGGNTGGGNTGGGNTGGGNTGGGSTGGGNTGGGSSIPSYSPFYVSEGTHNGMDKLYQAKCLPCHTNANPQGGFSFEEYHSPSDSETDPIEKHRRAAIAIAVSKRMPPGAPLATTTQLEVEQWLGLNVPKTKAEYESAINSPSDCNTDPVPRLPISRLSTQQMIDSLRYLFDTVAFNGRMDSTLATEFSSLVDEAALIPGHPQNGYQKENAAQLSNFFWAMVSLSRKLVKGPSDSSWKKIYTTCLKRDRVPSDSCFNSVFSTWGLLLHGVPTTSADLAVLLSVYKSEPVHLDGLAQVWRMLLLNPRTSWRIYDQGTPDPSDPSVLNLTLYEQADLLSFATAGRKPGITLLNAAADGSLADNATFDTHFNRLLVDNKDYTERFVTEWWDVRSRPNYEMVPPKYISDTKAKLLKSNSTNTYAQSWSLMKRESRHIITQGLSYADFYTIGLPVEPESVWDQTPTTGNGYLGMKYLNLFYTGTSQASVPDIPEGRGVLNRIAFGLQNEATTRANTILRGFHIAKSAVCRVPGQFPEDSVIVANGTTVPVRVLNKRSADQVLETTQPVQCQQCHSLSDHFGIAMEGVDILGKRRTTERVYKEEGAIMTFLGSSPILNTSTFDLDGTQHTVTGPDELAQVFINSDTAQRCFERNILMMHALGQRNGNAATACMQDDFRNEMMKPGGSIRDALRRSLRVYLRKRRI